MKYRVSNGKLSPGLLGARAAAARGPGDAAAAEGSNATARERCAALSRPETLGQSETLEAPGPNGGRSAEAGAAAATGLVGRSHIGPGRGGAAFAGDGVARGALWCARKPAAGSAAAVSPRDVRAANSG